MSQKRRLDYCAEDNPKRMRSLEQLKQDMENNRPPQRRSRFGPPTSTSRFDQSSEGTPTMSKPETVQSDRQSRFSTPPTEAAVVIDPAKQSRFSTPPTEAAVVIDP